jgi:hypothetical protein
MNRCTARFCALSTESGVQPMAAKLVALPAKGQVDLCQNSEENPAIQEVI